MHFTITDAVAATLRVDMVVHKSDYFEHLVYGVQTEHPNIVRAPRLGSLAVREHYTTPDSAQGCPEHYVCETSKLYFEEHQRKTFKEIKLQKSLFYMYCLNLKPKNEEKAKQTQSPH